MGRFYRKVGKDGKGRKGIHHGDTEERGMRRGKKAAQIPDARSGLRPRCSMRRAIWSAGIRR
jgi:hypothetical protein